MDLTVCRRQWRASVQDVTTDHTAGLNSNHRLTVTTLRVKRGARKQKTGAKMKINRKPTLIHTDPH